MSTMSWRDAIIHVLRAAGRPLHYGDITERILRAGIKTSAAPNPQASVRGAISRYMKGSDSPFVRTDSGVYALTLPRDSERRGEVDLEPITAYGIHWRRDLIEWRTSDPRIYGRQHARADLVNLAHQSGVYVLYSPPGAAIFVGNAKRVGLGRRLLQHTSSGHWMWFSWFGIRPINDDGTLADSPADIPAATLIDAIEAVLIATVEPHQNSQHPCEFVQATDPRFPG